MQLPIFPPVGPTSGEGPERSKPSGVAPTSHKPGDGFLRVFGGMRPGSLKENELGSDPTMRPHQFADREASGPIRVPDDPGFSPGANPEDASVGPQSPSAADLAKSAAHTVREAGAEDAEPEPIAPGRKGTSAQGLGAFRPGPVVPNALGNAAKPDSTLDPMPNSALVSDSGFVSGFGPDSAAKAESRETDELLRNAAFSASTTATIPMPAEVQNFSGARLGAVAVTTMGVKLPLEQGHEIDNAAARLEPFVPDTLKNTSAPDSKIDPGPNSALVSGAGFVSGLGLDSATDGADAAEAATRLARPLNQGESVKIAAATVSGGAAKTTERMQASGPSAAISHNVAQGGPANSAAPADTAAVPRTSEAGPQRADGAGGKADSGHNEAPGSASSSGSKNAPGRAPSEKALPLATGSMEDRFVGSKETKIGPVPQAGDDANTGAAAAAPKTQIGAQRVSANPEAPGGFTQVTTMDIQMSRSDQGADISKLPNGKRSVGAASLSTSPLAATPSGPALSLPDGYAQMRGVGVEAKADRTPANSEPSAQSGGHTGSGVQISAPQAPGGIATQNGASAPAASPLPFTVLAADPSGTEKRRSLEPEAALAEVRGTSTPTISTGSAPTVTPHQETARAVMVQLAHSMRANADRAIELRLHPEELGHVRMTFSTDHGGLSVTLTADRSETLDLLRRNIDMLGDELRRIGYGTVDFSFGDDSHQRGGEAEPWSSGEASGALPESNPDHDHTEETKARATRGLAPAHGGVDMRI